MIDLELERKAFEEQWKVLGGHLLYVEWTTDHMYSLSATANALNKSDRISLFNAINTAWAMWLIQARAKQAEIDSLRAQQKLDKPARVGGTVFCEGVAWKTVIECAQRHYDYGQRNTQPTPLISPSDAIKLASGELVLVPKEPTEAMIKHAYGTYEGATILPYSFYKAMIEAAQGEQNEY